jgi:putative DNA primase/helicase
MNAQLRLVSDSASLLPHSNARPVLAIVKALGLDNVLLPDKQKPRNPSAKTAATLAAASNDDPIPESGRNNMLTSLAGSMRRKGMSEAAINAALQVENTARCDPPLDKSEVNAIACSIMRYAPSTSEKIWKSLNDIGNADRLGRRHVGEILYVCGLGWHIWNGLLWCRDAVGKIKELAKQVARNIYNESANSSGDALLSDIAKHAKASHQAPRLNAMIELAATLPELVKTTAQLDSHDMLLGVANGVIDLRTGKLRPVDREQFMTRHSGVSFDAKATCPQFLTFIDQITATDKSLAQYLQRVVGYALTGATSEQCLFFLYGSGANGKSTFLNVVLDLLGGDLARQTPSETLMAKRSSQTNDLARLQSVRVVIATEVESGAHLAESQIKQMTGGDKIPARFHYQEFFEFYPKFKLFIAGNHKPVVTGRDIGIWRRIRLIPFEVSIPKAQRDQNLQAKLRAELPGILNWAIKGCKDWKKNGLGEPRIVTQAVADYKEEMDVVGQWMKDCCVLGRALECRAIDAYRSYKSWAEENGYRPMASASFGRDFVIRFTRVPRNDGNYYIGVSPK